MLQSRVVSNVRDYTNNQLTTAGLSLDDLVSSGLIDLAGCGLSASWFTKLLADRVRKIKALQLIGLRRLFGDPIDIIIGAELFKVKNPKRLGGLKRIRYELNAYRPKKQKDICEMVNCSHPIIARIETASFYAVRERWADIDTPAEKIHSGFLSKHTFSVDILIRLKVALNMNIDDIMGMGDYHAECRDGIEFRGGKLKQLRFHQADLDSLSPTQRKHPEQVFSPITVDDEPEPEPVKEISPELQAMFDSNRNRTASQPDEVTGFRPKGGEDE